jgi:hypothetical protein
MNIRYAVICERLRLRYGTGPVTTEEQLQATERSLGFPLPSMLRALYLQVRNGGRGIVYGLTLSGARPAPQAQDAVLSPGHEPVPATPLSALEKSKLKGGPPLSAALVEALQCYVGSYVSWDDDDAPEKEPSGFIQLGLGEPNLLLDGHTGYLYYAAGDEDSVNVSFCAPSVEDWLERVLDAPLHRIVQYFPHTELTALAQAEEHEAATEERRETLPDTVVLRRENLSDEPDPHDYRKGLVPLFASDVTIRQTDQQLERERHEVLRQLYSLMEVFEAEQEAGAGRSAGIEAFLEGLRSLLEADAHLATVTEKIKNGTSELYERHWSSSRLADKLRKLQE